MLPQYKSKNSSSSNNNNNNSSNTSSSALATMKTFRLVPFVLAGFCGYLHTVLKSHFRVGSDVMSDQLRLQRHMIDMPKLSDASRVTSSTSSLVNNNKQSSQGKDSSIQTQSTLSSISTSSSSLALRKTSMDEFVKAVPSYQAGQDSAAHSFVPPDQDHRVPALSDDFQTALLQYTMELLPHHMDAQSAAAAAGQAEPNDADKDDMKNPKPYNFQQIDILVPASGQDDRLRLFAEHLGVALKHFQQWYQTERRPAILRTLKQKEEEEGAEILPEHLALDLTFRLLVTRYPQDEQKTDADIKKFQRELADKTGLPRKQIVLIRVGHDAGEDNKKNNADKMDDDANTDDSVTTSTKVVQFQRGPARNVLHDNACGDETCIVTAMDVDIQVLPIYFHRALKAAEPHVKAYFPIVFSEFNPATVQLVQDYLYPPEDKEDEQSPPELLPPYSKHRGLWRDFGYGMYVLSGPDAMALRFNERYQGWGHEDNDFYNLVRNSLRVDRKHEHGLIHQWHPKDCSIGKDIVTEQQWVDCLNSRDVMEGSALGMLLRPPLPPRTGFPGTGKNDAGQTVQAANVEKEHSPSNEKLNNEAENNDEAQSENDNEAKLETKEGESSTTAKKNPRPTSFQHKYKAYKKTKTKKADGVDEHRTKEEQRPRQ